jgi:hypothetical protein
VIQDDIEHLIADGLLAESYEKGDVLVARVVNGEVVMDVTHEA